MASSYKPKTFCRDVSHYEILGNTTSIDNSVTASFKFEEIYLRAFPLN